MTGVSVYSLRQFPASFVRPHEQAKQSISIPRNTAREQWRTTRLVESLQAQSSLRRCRLPHSEQQQQHRIQRAFQCNRAATLHDFQHECAAVGGNKNKFHKVMQDWVHMASGIRQELDTYLIAAAEKHVELQFEFNIRRERLKILGNNAEQLFDDADGTQSGERLSKMLLEHFNAGATSKTNFTLYQHLLAFLKDYPLDYAHGKVVHLAVGEIGLLESRDVPVDNAEIRSRLRGTADKDILSFLITSAGDKQLKSSTTTTHDLHKTLHALGTVRDLYERTSLCKKFVDVVASLHIATPSEALHNLFSSGITMIPLRQDRIAHCEALHTQISAMQPSETPIVLENMLKRIENTIAATREGIALPKILSPSQLHFMLDDQRAAMFSDKPINKLFASFEAETDA